MVELLDYKALTLVFLVQYVARFACVATANDAVLLD